MQQLRQQKTIYISKNIIPVRHDNNQPSCKKQTEKLCKEKKSDREEFVKAFINYTRQNMYNIKKGNKKYKLKDKYNRLSLYTFCYTLNDINENFYHLSKQIRNVYKYDNNKINKIDSDTIIFNLAKSYINDINHKHSKNDSLFDIYATYNYTVDGISYEYLRDFHNDIKKLINKTRTGYEVKVDLKSPKYVDKVGLGRKKLFILAFKLVTMSNDITCDIPRKKYLNTCDTKEDFIEVYELLGGGIRKYMQYYSVSPLFEVFIKAVRKSNIINDIYKNYNLSSDAILGICSMLFTQQILSSYGTRKSIKNMLDVQSESYRQLGSLIQLLNFT